MLNKTILTIITSILMITVNAQSDNDVLMTVGGNDVTVGEFRYIYEKNNGKTADYSQESLDEYVDLYTKFKLKVAKAKEMQLDTIVALQKELDGYRTQLANSFLTDREVTDRLITEIKNRKAEDVKISHILVKLNGKASFSQEEKAKKKLLNFKQQLREGKPFGALAKEYSEDRNTKDKGGSLGFVTATLPSGFYELENAMYNLNVGEVSDPIRTKLGYHLVKVIEKRPARGKVEVAHIFTKVDKTDRKVLETNKKLMDSIYLALQGGADFSALAKKYSQDKTTKDKGGLLPPFGIAVYDGVFEDTAFGLDKDGQVSRPILTSVGYHIIKRISKVAPDTEQQLRLQYKEKLRKYDRHEVAMDKMITKIKETSKFKEKRNILNKFTNSLDQSFYSYKWKPAKDLGTSNLLSFGPDANESIMDFALYAKRQTRLRSKFDKDKPLAEAVEEIYSEFVKDRAYKYEQDNLEGKYPEFKSLMREYQEGILLFEATKINVWDKANTDTVGLYSFYEQNKSQYTFEEQATIGKYIVNTTDAKQLKKVMKCAKKRTAEKTMKRFNKDGVNMVEYSEVTVEPGSKELVGLEFKKKSISEPIVDNKNKKSLFKKVVKISASRRKTLKEARGYVVADYQDQLEKRWIAELKRDYPIKINNDVLKSLVKK